MRQYLLVGLIVFGLGALIVGGTTQIAAAPPLQESTPTPHLVLPVPEWFAESVSWGSPAVSPDGQWVALVRPNAPIQVWASADPDTIYTDDQPLGPYTFFRAWSPNSSTFGIFDADQGCERCPFDRLIVYMINGGQVARYVYAPTAEPNRAFWLSPVWSPDGRQMAVLVGSREIHILDAHAQLISVLTPPDGAHLNGIIWTTWGLIYWVRPENARQAVEIYLHQPDIVAGDELVFSSDANLRVLSADYDSPRLMIHHYTNLPGQPTSGEIAILNTATHQLEEALLTHDDQYPYFSALDGDAGHVVALLDQAGQLFTYSWYADELHDQQLRVTRLIQWRQDLGAFIVLRSPSPQDQTFANSWLESVVP